MSSYQKIVEVATIFFAILVGFSLQHVLEVPGGGKDFLANRWLLFLTGTSLFLRFLTGSAVHLWCEHLQPDSPRGNTGRIRFDFFSLLLFGTLGIFAFYQDTVREFLWWTTAFVGAAILWGVINRLLNNKSSPWDYWMKINATQIIALLLAILLYTKFPVGLTYLWAPVSTWSLWLTILAAVFAACLYWDVKRQLDIVPPSSGEGGDDATDNSENGGGSRSGASAAASQ